MDLHTHLHNLSPCFAHISWVSLFENKACCLWGSERYKIRRVEVTITVALFVEMNWLRCVVDLLLLFVFQLFLLAYARVEPAIVVNNSCPAGCSANGNCNGETGLCECPFGFGGELAPKSSPQSSSILNSTTTWQTFRRPRLQQAAHARLPQFTRYRHFDPRLWPFVP